MSEIYFKKVAIIGVGLIGGSLAMALRQKGLAGTIVGIGRGTANLEDAKRLGIVNSFTREIAEGVEGADLVVIAVPVLKIAETVRKAIPYLKPGCIITDVGSVKKAVIEKVEPIMPPGISFVPGHPISGTENSGAASALPGLFVDRNCILTPTGNTDSRALEVITSMWRETGSRVILMDAATHDRILAAVSHLPHMIAYALVNTVAEVGKNTDMLAYSAGGFKDFTRIASSSPEMWSDICALNRDSIIEMIGTFQKRLDKLKRLITEMDLKGLKEDFENAKRLRDSLTAASASGKVKS